MQVEEQVETKMKDAMMNYGKSDYEGVTRSWDTVQRDVCILIILYKNKFIHIGLTFLLSVFINFFFKLNISLTYISVKYIVSYIQNISM